MTIHEWIGLMQLTASCPEWINDHQMHKGAMTETSLRRRSSSLNNRAALLCDVVLQRVYFENCMKPCRLFFLKGFSLQMTFSITYETEREQSLVKNSTLSSDFTASLGCHVQLEAMGRNYSVFKPISGSKNKKKSDKLFFRLSLC